MRLKRRQPWSFWCFVFCVFFKIHTPRFQWAPLRNTFWGVRITLSHSNVTFTELVHQSSTTDVWKAESIKASILSDQKTLRHGAGAQTESTEVHAKQRATLVREHLSRRVGGCTPGVSPIVSKAFNWFKSPLLRGESCVENLGFVSHTATFISERVATEPFQEAAVEHCALCLS